MPPEVSTVGRSPSGRSRSTSCTVFHAHQRPTSARRLTGRNSSRCGRSGGLSRAPWLPGDRTAPARGVAARPAAGVRRALSSSRGEREPQPVDRTMIFTTLPILDRGYLDLAAFPWEAFFVRVDVPMGPVDFLTTHFASSANNPLCAGGRMPADLSGGDHGERVQRDRGRRRAQRATQRGRAADRVRRPQRPAPRARRWRRSRRPDSSTPGSQPESRSATPPPVAAARAVATDPRTHSTDSTCPTVDTPGASTTSSLDQDRTASSVRRQQKRSPPSPSRSRSRACTGRATTPACSPSSPAADRYLMIRKQSASWLRLSKRVPLGVNRV